MKTNSNSAVLNSSPDLSPSMVSDLIEVTKPRITFLILIATFVSYFLAVSDNFSWIILFNTLFGTALTSSGTAALNMFMERKHDAQMKRTQNRPLPTGRIEPSVVLLFGGFISITGIVYLYFTVNMLTSVLAFLTWSGYLFIYTPMKRLTSLNTVIGAIPGALPALGGWAAASNSLDAGAWILFAIMFFWQFPHFLAIAWLYREDYARGGYAMLSKMNDDGVFLSRQMVLYTIGLLVVSLMPSVLGISGLVYFISALILSSIFIIAAIRFSLKRSEEYARKVLYFSFIYPLLLWAILIFDKQ